VAGERGVEATVGMMTETKYVAFGAGGAFQNVVINDLLPVRFEYAVDNHFTEPAFRGIPVRRPADLIRDVSPDIRVVVFAMSSAVHHMFRRQLLAQGFGADQIVPYGDLFFEGLRRRLAAFGVRLDPAHYAFAQRASMVFPIDNHSSALGTAVLLGLMAATNPSTAVAELGAYKGGNALLAALVATLQGSSRPYHIVDSFEGFPELSAHDPADASKMFRDSSFADIAEMFAAFPHVRLHRGFIPDVLRQLPDQHYGVVYYDCDLYQPAVDSLQYFFPRLSPGGFLLVHDYLPKLGGFDGVRKAVDEFLRQTKGVDRFEVPETTHLILRKG